MANGRFTEEEIGYILEKLDDGMSLEELSRRHKVSERTIQRWRATHTRPVAQQGTREEELEQENRRLKEQLAERAPVAEPVSAPAAEAQPWLGIRGGAGGWVALLLLCAAFALPLCLPIMNDHGMQLQKERIESFARSQNATQLEQLSFEGLPDQHIDGAWLPRGSLVPYALAGGCAAAFLLLLAVLFPRARRSGFAAAGVFTAVAGMALLYGFQWIAATQIPTEHLNPLWVPLAWLVNLIGGSYGDLNLIIQGVEVPFPLLLLTFLLTAGLCEETCKAIPYLSTIGSNELRGKAGAGYGAQRLFTIGFASGIGFGLAEAISYSMQQFNGLQPLDLYVIRYGAVVGLHAVWAASAALKYYELQEEFESGSGFGPYGWLWRLARVIAVPALLHALYDSVSTRGMDVAAIALALVSVAYLGWRVFQAENRRRLVGDTA